MALVYIDVQAPCGTARLCDDVYLCLVDDWADKTVSGIALVKGHIQLITEIGNATNTPTDPCHPDWGNVDCSVQCSYKISVDNEQIEVDPGTGSRYILTAGDVSEIFPYVCIIDKILADIAPGIDSDWVVDQDNVTLVTDIPTGLHTFTIPIIDHIDNSPQGSFEIEFNTSVLTVDELTSSMTFFPGIGPSTTINFCDMIEGCMDGVSIVRNVDGTYSAPQQVLDGDTINFSVSGVHNEILSGEVVLDPDPGNILSASAAGLLGTIPLSVTDTDSVDLTLALGVLEADVKLDTTTPGGNALTLVPGVGGGLYVTPATAGNVDTASNVGSAGTGVFKQKTGTDLEFYKLNSLSSALSIALDGTDKIDFDLVAATGLVPGIVSTGVQTLAGAKTFSTSISTPIATVSTNLNLTGSGAALLNGSSVQYSNAGSIGTNVASALSLYTDNITRIAIGTTSIVAGLDIVPSVDSTYDLGTASLAFQNGVINTISSGSGDQLRLFSATGDIETNDNIVPNATGLRTLGNSSLAFLQIWSRLLDSDAALAVESTTTLNVTAGTSLGLSSTGSSNITLTAGTTGEIILASDAWPNANNANDLGSSALNFSEVHARNLIAAGTMNIETTTASDIVISTNGVERFKFPGSGNNVTSIAIRDNTTASAANIRIDPTSGVMQRSTSAAKYKTDIQDLVKFDADAVLGLRPVKYKSLAQSDNPDTEHIGLIAEEVEAIAPWLVEYFITDEGVKIPDSVQYERLSVLLLAIIKEQQDRLNNLESRLSALEGVKG